MREALAALTRNTMSLLGSAVVVISGILLLTLISIEMFGTEGHAYVGIITYMILPTVFAAGLFMIVWGVIRERKRTPDIAFPVIDLNVPRVRRRLVAFLVMISVCVIILGTATSGAVHFMESNTFCGTICHEVMAPEYTAYQRSPHARVNCVDCHIGPGTDWFVKSKLSGAWQLVSVTFDLYDRPIPTPVHNLRPSSGTCEQCHWPSKFHGIQPKVFTRFAEDEANTETKTILMLKTGGHDFEKYEGIHWHIDPGVKIRYRSDENRETMHEVELTLKDGTVKRYFGEGTDDTGTSGWRTMDCVDCHNRPTHVFYGAAEAVDLTLERGIIKKDLPYLKREAVRAITTDYASHEEAREGIARTIADYYETNHRELAARRAGDIEKAGRVLGDVYASNVFPSMKLDWGTYPSHIGHEKSPGCFRCHAGNHATADGETITVDCRVCHSIVAWDDASPQILELIPD
jgi:nitrate/TMAO reductase-like tetraheme cytochrome c subunit